MQTITPPPTAAAVAPPVFVKETGLSEVAQATTLAGAVSATAGDTLTAFIETNQTSGGLTPVQVGAEWGGAQTVEANQLNLASHTVTVGNDILVSVTAYNPSFSARPNIVVGDNSGASNIGNWQQIAAAGPTTLRTVVWRCTNAAAGAIVINAVVYVNGLPTNCAIQASAVEIANLSHLSTVDVQGSRSNGTGSTTPFALTAGQTSQGGELVYGAIGCANNTTISATTFTPSTTPTVGQNWATANPGNNLRHMAAFEVSGAATGTQQIAATLSGSVIWGALIVTFQGAPASGGPSTVSTVTDTGGNVWSRLAQKVSLGAASNQSLEAWSTVVATSPGTLTITATSACIMVAEIVEVRGEGIVQSVTITSGTGTPVVTGAAVNANSTDLVVAVVAQSSNATFSSPSPTWTALSQRNSVGGGFGVLLQAAYLLPGVVASQSFQVASNDASAAWAAFIIVWNGSGSTVTSVAGRTGAVVLTGADLGSLNVSLADWLPEDTGVGCLAWDYDPVGATATLIMVVGSVYVMRVKVDRQITVNNVLFHDSVAGSAVTQSGAAIYNATGTALADAVNSFTPSNGTAANAAYNAASGLQTLALTGATVLAPGQYLVALWIGAATTAPTLNRASASAVTLGNAGTSGTGVRFGVGATGLVTSTAPASLAVAATNSPVSYWVGLS